jgi:Asp-tRNA(Asn)/Glu-tRNA(Gln) amidotransferase B subunit
VTNGKDVMMKVIDGDKRSPKEIAEELGYVGETITTERLSNAVDEIIFKNKEIVSKIIKTGKTGPTMALVGQVMELLNKRGDPKMIKVLIDDAIL